MQWFLILFRSTVFYEAYKGIKWSVAKIRESPQIAVVLAVLVVVVAEAVVVVVIEVVVVAAIVAVVVDV